MRCGRLKAKARLLFRADKRTRRKMWILQRLPIWGLNAIFLGVLFIARGKVVLTVLLCAFSPSLPLIAVATGWFSSVIGPYDEALRKEYARLLEAAEEQAEHRTRWARSARPPVRASQYGFRTI